MFDFVLFFSIYLYLYLYFRKAEKTYKVRFFQRNFCIEWTVVATSKKERKLKIQEALEILMKIKLQFGDDLEIVVQSVDQDGYDDAAIVIEPLAERETKRYEHEGLYIDQPIWGEQTPQEKFKNRVAFIRTVPANPDLIIQPGEEKC